MANLTGLGESHYSLQPFAFAAMATGGAILAATATVLWHSYSSSSRSAVKLLPVTSYRQPKFPLVMRFMASLPHSWRRFLSIMGSKPDPPLDSVDVGLAAPSPYLDKKEIVPQKLWRVRYQHAIAPKFIYDFRDVFGVDLMNATPLQGCKEDEIQKCQVIRDRVKQLVQECDGLDEKACAKIMLQAGLVQAHNMLVVRLDDDSTSTGAGAGAGLLLFNPCRFHPELTDYLQNEIGGPVKYIVSGSSYHTNQLPQAAAIFPNAKIICSHAAQQKCMAVGMRPADFIYTDPADFQRAQALLAPAGVQLFHVQGDTLTQSLLLVAHRHLLEVDLTCYGNGRGHACVSDQDWNDNSINLMVGFMRLFYHAGFATATVAPGYLPDYRVMCFDPTCLFNKLCLDEPKPDGSSCLEMAQSLRRLLTTVDFDYAHNAHTTRAEPMTAHEYKQIVNHTWSWLVNDGKNLLMEPTTK